MPEKEKTFFCGCTPRDSAFSLGVLMTMVSLLSFCGALKSAIGSFHSTSIASFFSLQSYIFGEQPNLILAFRFALVILVLLTLIMLSANILLITGLMKDKAELVKKWKITCIAMSFMYFVDAASLAILCFMSQCSDTIASFFVVAGFVHACLVLYVVSIINFHQKFLEEKFKKFTNSEA